MTDFSFDVYRINKREIERDLFDQDSRPASTDAELLAILKTATGPQFELKSEAQTTVYSWALRGFATVEEERELGSVHVVTIARSVLEKDGPVVTDEGLTDGHTEMYPAPAEPATLILYMSRHLVAVERTAITTSSQAWRKAFTALFQQAAEYSRFSTVVDLEPVPAEKEILEAFKSFSRLTRLRVKLRLPNPETSRRTQELYENLRNGGIQEYRQDMRNPGGLVKTDGELPQATAEIAQAGYKEGAVLMEGVRDGRKQNLAVGAKAARGNTPTVSRDFVRGMAANAKAKEAKEMANTILAEIDRVAPNLEDTDGV